MTKKVIIASKNPVKINAVKIGFEKMFPNDSFKFEGASISSDVKDQPVDNAETILGATNRANNAKAQFPDANFWVGIEGGVEKNNTEMSAFAWVVIKTDQSEGKAKTGIFFLPKKIVELINEGKELGEADDIVFGYTNSKKQNGAVGILTGDNITRTNYYAEAIILALIPFNNPDIY